MIQHVRASACPEPNAQNPPEGEPDSTKLFSDLYTHSLAHAPTHIILSNNFWMFIYSVLCAHVYACVYSAHQEHGAQKTVLGCMLGTKPGSFPNAINTLNYEVISPSP